MATTINLQPGDGKNYKGHNGGLLSTAQIMSTAGGGAINETITDVLVDGIAISWDGADVMNAVDPIVGSTCELTFMVDTHAELNALRTLALGSEAETMLQLAWSNGDYWYGSLLPEETVTDVSDGPTTIKLRFADGLGLLKDIDFKDANGDPFSQGTTGISTGGNLLKWAYLALDKIPYHTQVSPVTSEWIRETPALEAISGVDSGTFGTFLSDTFTNAKSWDQDRSVDTTERDRRDLPQKRGFQSAYDVLVDICQTSGYRLVWNMRGWHFFSPLNYTGDYSVSSHTSFIWSRSDFSTIATGSQGFDTATGKTANAFDPRFDLDSYYHLSSAKTQFALPVGSTIATHLEVSGADVVTDNGDFFAKASNQPSWNIETGNRHKHSFSDLEIVEGAEMKMRFHSYIETVNYNDGGWLIPDTNQDRAGMKPCLVFRASVGTASGVQHWLDGPVKSAPENTKLTGAGADYFGQAWGVFDDATWSTDSSKLCYIPFNSFGHSDPVPEAISYLNAAGDEIYSFPMPFNAKLKNNETNVVKETTDYDRGEIDWVRSFIAPTGAGDMTGATLDIGIAVFSWDGEELFNSLDPSRATLHGSVGVDIITIENLFNPVQTNDIRMIRNFEVWNASFTLGTDRGDDRDYYNEGGRGSIPIRVIETRIASRNGALWGGAPGTINPYVSTGGGSFDADAEYRIRWNTSNTNVSNIDLLAEEWLRMLNGSAEGIQSDLIPKFDQVHQMLTPDMLAYTACLGGGTTYVLPTALEYRLSSGLNMAGYVADRRDAVSVIDKPPSLNKPRWLETTLAGGKGRPSTSVNPGTDVNNFFGKTTGGNNQVSLENQAALAAFENGFVHLDGIFGNTGSFAAGEWTGNTVNLSPATEGDVLTYTAASGWAPGTGGGGGLSTFSSGFTITDPVGTQTTGQTIATGADVEQYLVDMVVSYQKPRVTLSGWAFSGGKEHGTTGSDSTFTLAFTNDSNIDPAFTGTAAFTDTYMTNQTTTGITASDGSKTMAACSGTYLITNAATAGTGSSRSRGSAGKLTVSGFKDTNGDTILDPFGNSTETTNATVYYRSKVVRNSTNYAGGAIDLAGMNALWASVNAASTYFNVLSSNPWPSQQTSYGLNSITASDYAYVLVPESIWTYNGGTTTGLGTADIKTYSAGLAYSAPMDWCGTQTIEPQAGHPVKYHAIRVGQTGAMADLPIWFG